MATDPPHSPDGVDWSRPICSMCKESMAVCVGPYAGGPGLSWMRCSGCCKETHLTGTCVPIGDEAMERVPGPTFNHTRSDGPFDPCPACAALMSPAAREPLYRDVLTGVAEAVREEGHRLDFLSGSSRAALERVARILKDASPVQVREVDIGSIPSSPPTLADNGWTEANECDVCRGKPGAPYLCAICLGRRGLRAGVLIIEPQWLAPGMRVKTHGGGGCEATLTERPEAGYWKTTDRGMNVYDDSFAEFGVIFLDWTDPKDLNATAVNRDQSPRKDPGAAVAPTPPSGERPETLPAGVGVDMFFATLTSDRFRYSLHRWMDDRVRQNLDRSPTDNVTDLLHEIVERLRVICPGKSDPAAGEPVACSYPLVPLCLREVDNGCPCWLYHGHLGDCVCMCQVKGRQSRIQGDPLTLPAGGQVGRAR